MIRFRADDECFSFLHSSDVFLHDGQEDVAVDLSAALSEPDWLVDEQIPCCGQQHSGKGQVPLHKMSTPAQLEIFYRPLFRVVISTHARR